MLSLSGTKRRLPSADGQLQEVVSRVLCRFANIAMAVEFPGEIGCWCDRRDRALKTSFVRALCLRLIERQIDQPTESWWVHVLEPLDLEVERQAATLQASFREAAQELDSVIDRLYSDVPIELCENLSHLSTMVLDVQLSLEGGSVRVARLSGGHKKVLVRKGSGIYYTPRDLASTIVRDALERLVQDEDGAPLRPEAILDLRVLDPACGTGIFLVSVYMFLEQALIRSRAFWTENCTKVTGSIKSELAERCIYGVDLEPYAISTARFCLWFATGHDPKQDPFQFCTGIREGNALVGAAADYDPGSLPVGRKLFAKAFPNQPLNDAERRRRQDHWCALWFMSDEQIADLSALNGRLQDKDGSIEEVCRRWRFFHWQLEYPQVFSGPNPGFDAIVGNPPWEIKKASSREVFARFDQQFYGYGKQEALRRQAELIAEHPGLGQRWRQAKDEHRRFSRWVKHVPGAVDGSKPGFAHQGRGDANMYKLFVEQTFNLTRCGGTFALLVPAGLYCDMGAQKLRQLLLLRCDWQRLIGFENTDSTFAIHRSFKYCYFVAQKGGETESVDCSFLNLAGSFCREVSSNVDSLQVKRLEIFSPNHSIFLETEGSITQEVLDRIYNGCKQLGNYSLDGLKLLYQRELDMTLSSSSFLMRDEIEAVGYEQDCYGNWLRGNWRTANSDIAGNGAVLSATHEKAISIEDIDQVAIPLYEGRMVGQYCFNKKRWIGGKGRRAVWEPQGEGSRGLGPQYLIDLGTYRSDRIVKGLKTGFLAVGSDTNARTMIASCLNAVPCGNSVHVWQIGAWKSKFSSAELQLFLTAVFNSFVFDFVLRRRMAGTNLNYFVLEECPIPDVNRLKPELVRAVARLTADLNLRHVRFAEAWRELGFENLPPPLLQPSPAWTRALVECLVAHAYGLEHQDMRTILSGCMVSQSVQGRSRDFSLESASESCMLSSPVESHCLGKLLQHLSKSLESRSLLCLKSNPKGFWRVDSDLPMSERLPVLTLALSETLEQLSSRWLTAELLTLNRGEPSTQTASSYQGSAIDHYAVLDRILSLELDENEPRL